MPHYGCFSHAHQGTAKAEQKILSKLVFVFMFKTAGKILRNDQIHHSLLGNKKKGSEQTA